MRKFNIVFLINSSFPYYSGGRETWLYNISKHLIEKGHSVYIISHENTKRDLHFTDIPDKIEIISCKSLKNITFIKPFIRSYLKILDSILLSFQMYKKIIKRFSKNYKNYIFISLDTIYTALAIRMMKRRFKDLIYICSNKGPHADVLSAKFPSFSLVFHYMEKKAYDTADEIWANGRDTQLEINRHGFDSVLIGNGVDIKAIDEEKGRPKEQIFKNKKFKITSIATLLNIKGINELLEAGSILIKNKISDVNLIFIGKGNPVPYIDYANKLKIADKVFFLGAKKNVVPYLKNSELIACLSGGGGMSMSALEALASKTPVIAWQSPAYEQLIEHQINGILVKDKNVQELANAIYSIKNNYSKYKRMALEARKRVEIFDWEKITRKIIIRLKKISDV